MFNVIRNLGHLENSQTQKHKVHTNKHLLNNSFAHDIHHLPCGTYNTRKKEESRCGI